MTEIKLDSLKINNFKGIRNFELCPRGRSMDIYGDNATGKTTVYDALMWLLFDRDSMENTRFDIKPLKDDGSVKDSGTVTEVSAVLNINGEPLKLKKTYYEKWSGKRGSMEKTFDGNTSDYYIDDVPLKKYEYEERIKGIIDKDMFKLLTNVNYFAKTLPWQERRRILFELCALPADRDIIETDDRFCELTSQIGRGSVMDLKKKLLARRGSLAEIKHKLPTKIESIENTVFPYLDRDYEALSEQRDTLQFELDMLKRERTCIDNDTICLAKKKELSDIKGEILALKTQNAEYRANEGRGGDRVHEIKFVLESKKRELSAERSLFDKVRDRAEATKKRISQLRREWEASANNEWDGERICPTCGREYDEETIENAKIAFEKHKAAELSKIQSLADEEKALLYAFEQEMNAATEKTAVLSDEIRELQLKIENEPVIEIYDMPGYHERMSELCAKQDLAVAELSEYEAGSKEKRRELVSRIDAVSLELKEVSESLGGRAFISRCNEEITRLMDEARDVSIELEQIEKTLFLIEEFIKYKVSFVTDCVNDKFKLARFKLFQTQVNGGVCECCSVTYKGVDFSGGLNSGARICVGMDIIGTLSESFGISVPLFIDNAESVTSIYPLDTQVIRLIVSRDDKKLRCEAWDL